MKTFSCFGLDCHACHHYTHTHARARVHNPMPLSSQFLHPGRLFFAGPANTKPETSIAAIRRDTTLAVLDMQAIPMLRTVTEKYSVHRRRFQCSGILLDSARWEMHLPDDKLQLSKSIITILAPAPPVYEAPAPVINQLSFIRFEGSTAWQDIRTKAAQPHQVGLLLDTVFDLTKDKREAIKWWQNLPSNLEWADRWTITSRPRTITHPHRGPRVTGGPFSSALPSVPQRIKDKIVRGEYIDFTELSPDNSCFQEQAALSMRSTHMQATLSVRSTHMQNDPLELFVTPGTPRRHNGLFCMARGVDRLLLRNGRPRPCARRNCWDTISSSKMPSSPPQRACSTTTRPSGATPPSIHTVDGTLFTQPYGR